MSHSSKIFESVPTRVPNKNGFDLSHLNCGTSKTGQLVPVMCKLLPPNSDFTLGISMNVNLPPLAAPFYGRVDAICEGFVIPLSMLYGGFKVFMTNQQDTEFPASQDSIHEYVANDSGELSNRGYQIPYIGLSTLTSDNPAQFNELMKTNDNIVEYLGLRAPEGTITADIRLSLLPMLAYHLCWNVYYRNKQVTKTIFAVNPNRMQTTMNTRNVSLIWHSFYSDAPSAGGNPFSPNFGVDMTEATATQALTFPDGVSLFSTRQRCYARDYFTAGLPSPQQGNPSRVVFDTSGSEGGFTINALRAANSLQIFLEKNALSGDFAEMTRNRWGSRPIDADFDEPYYLGRVVLPVYQHSVYQQQNTSGTSGEQASPNTFVSSGALGARGSSGSFNGEGSICDKFHNSTWSYVMCLFSLVPHASYGYGLNRELTMVRLGDFPAPELQSIGNEAIKRSEVYLSTITTGDPDFCYTGRNSRLKYMDDEIHGELRPGRTLDSFVLQRVFTGIPQFNTSFVEIPQDALDDVFAVATEEMNLSCWYEIYFSFKVAMPLADYAIPTLGGLQDSHTINTKQGGSRL